MKIINIGICDSNSDDYKQINRMVDKCFCEIQYIIKYFHKSDLLFLENINTYNLIFLNLDMENKVGLSIGQQLRKRGYRNDIILYGLTDEYAFDAYSIQPFGYLIKPLSFQQMKKVLERYISFRLMENKIFWIRDSRRIPKYSISIFKIEYIESANTKLTIHLLDKSSIFMYGKLNDIEKEMNDDRFMRCHQSYLVNMDYIKDVNDIFEMVSGVRVPIRVRNKSHIKKRYYQYILESK